MALSGVDVFAEGFPRQVFGVDLVDSVRDGGLEVGKNIGAGLVEGQREGLYVFGTAGGEGLEVGGDGAGGDVVDAAAPGFGIDFSAGGPAFVGEVGDGFGEGGVGAVVEALDAVEGAIDEEGFEDELVPSVFGEVIFGEVIVEGDGVEDIDDVGTGGFAGEGDEGFGFGEVWEGLEDDNGLADVGGAEEGFEGGEVGVAGLGGEFEEEDLAGDLVGAAAEVAGGAGEGVVEGAGGEVLAEGIQGGVEGGEGVGGGFRF